MKPTIKRRSESPRAKRQQQDRRGESLFKKACEYSIECDAEVFLGVKIKRNGQIFFFNSEKSREWLPLDEQMVGHLPSSYNG
jgi:SRF-type transcription factor (DNA-binding and dimerisation domain)